MRVTRRETSMLTQCTIPGDRASWPHGYRCPIWDLAVTEQGRVELGTCAAGRNPSQAIVSLRGTLELVAYRNEHGIALPDKQPARLSCVVVCVQNSQFPEPPGAKAWEWAAVVTAFSAYKRIPAYSFQVRAQGQAFLSDLVPWKRK